MNSKNMLPEGWEIRKLGEVIHYKKGFAFKSGDYQKEGVRIIRVSDINFDSIKEEGNIFISRDMAGKYKDYELHTDDIIIATVGSRPPLYDSMVGKATIVSEQYEGTLLNQNAVKVFANQTNDSRFIYNHLKTFRYVRYIETLIRGNANQVSITLEELFDFDLILPPLAEQKKIAKILSVWDIAIGQTEKLIAFKVRQKRGLMQQLLTGRKRLQKFAAQEWKQVHLYEIVKDVIRPVTWDDDELYKLASVRRWSGGLFLRESLYGRQIKVKKLKTICEGDFLISHIQSAYGAMAIVPEGFDDTKVSELYTCLTPIDENKFDMRFLYYLSQTPHLWHMAYMASNGFFAERLRLNFNPEEFLKTKVLIPACIEEQRHIIAILETCDKEVELLSKHLDALKRQKRGLMQKLLTGQIRVKVDDFEAAVVEAG